MVRCQFFTFQEVNLLSNEKQANVDVKPWFRYFITFYRHNSDGRNHTITRDIFREDNRSTWKINGKTTTMKEVQELTKKLNVQIANLCQFLPQVWRNLQSHTVYTCKLFILVLRSAVYMFECTETQRFVLNIVLVAVGISFIYNAYKFVYSTCIFDWLTDRQTD